MRNVKVRKHTRNLQSGETNVVEHNRRIKSKQHSNKHKKSNLLKVSGKSKVLENKLDLRLLPKKINVVYNDGREIRPEIIDRYGNIVEYEFMEDDFTMSVKANKIDSNKVRISYENKYSGEKDSKIFKVKNNKELLKAISSGFNFFWDMDYDEDDNNQ